MSVDHLLAHLQDVRIRLWVDGDRLRYSAPKGVMTPELHEELSANKEALRERLLTQVPDAAVPELVRVDRTATLPLSFAQERLWFLDQLAPGNPLFNMNVAVRLSQPLSAAVLRRSLEEVVRRHEILRTTFPSVDGRPVQSIGPPGGIDFEELDLTGLPAPAAEGEAARLAELEARHAFDLAVGPLVRTRVLRLGTTDHVLLLTMHHILSDGWSMRIFFQELTDIYGAFALGRPSPLPELPLQYVDFAVWQRAWLSEKRLDQQLDYWRNQLAGIASLQLPTDRPRPVVDRYTGAQVPVALDGPLTAAVRDLGRAEGATPFMVLLAGFAMAMRANSGQDDIPVGTYIAGRNRAETEGLIGFFINTLVLRLDLSGEPTFRQLIARVRATAVDAYAHQDLPFARLVEAIEPSRDLSRNPLFQVVFQLFNAKPGGAVPGTDDLEILKVERGTSVFDLVFNLAEAGAGISGTIEYNTDLFDAETVSRIGEHWSTVLRAAVADPDRPLSQLDVLTADERRDVLRAWNDTARPFDLDTGLVELFDRQVRARPDAVAFTCGGRSLTFAQLDERSERLAAALRDRGVGPEVVVGLCLERSLDTAIGLIGVLKAGSAYLPLDPSYPRRRLRFMLTDSGAALLVTGSPLLGLFEGIEVETLCIEHVPLDAGAARYPVARPDIGPDRLAYVIYTSGSTGQPRGVAVDHGQVLNRLWWMWQDHPFLPGEVGCVKTPLGFVDSLWELLGPLLQGVPAEVVSDDYGRDVYSLVDALAAARVSRLWLVPSLLRALLDAHADLDRRLPDLRFWVTTGEALPGELVERFRAALPGARLYNLYGTSEVWDATWYDTDDLKGVPWRVPVGRAIANVTTYVLDSDLRPVPVGCPGELCVGGAGLARGYIGRPELSASRFVTHAFDGGPPLRLYRTGDLARWRPDGTIEYLGRLDHQVKLRGFRVELGEIEEALRRHPAVRQAVVTVRDDTAGGSGLVAYVVQDPDYLDGGGAGADWSDMQLPQWREVWEDTYEREVDDATFNTTGFVSSYTARPIPDEEVREWVDQAVERVMGLQPERVLDVGCGTGLVLLGIAPFVSRYVGTDFSPAALRLLQRTLRDEGLQDRVQLLERQADDFDGIAPGAFDVVVLHSVVQYFPHVDYLVRVLESALQALGPEGAVYLGDVRALPLLEVFHSTVELAQASGSHATAQVRQRVSKRMTQEKELLLDKGFFPALAERFPAITGVDVHLKRGRLHNEFSAFRYDVVLRTGRPAPPHGDARELDWGPEGMGLDGLRSLLADTADEPVVVREIPNARLTRAVRCHRLLFDPDGPDTVAALRRGVDATPAGVDPEDIWELAARTGHRPQVTWSAAGTADRFDVTFHPRSGGSGAPSGARRNRPATPSRPLRAYANNPSQALFATTVVPAIRAALHDELPDHMVPSSFVLLDAVPLTPSGKVDRQALPPPDLHRAGGSPYEAPRTAVERIMVELFGAVLGLEQVGIRDDFFTELGGHSLLATQVVSRLRDLFAVDVPLRLIFENPTPAGMAAAMLADPTSGVRVARTAELVLELDRMSEVEAEALLADGEQ